MHIQKFHARAETLYRKWSADTDFLVAPAVSAVGNVRDSVYPSSSCSRSGLDMSHEETVHKINKYVHQLRKEEKIARALSKLDKIDMTVELLQETEVGKAVNRLRGHDEHGRQASRIVERWMKMCERNGICRGNKVPKDEPMSDPEPDVDDDDLPASSLDDLPAPAPSLPSINIKREIKRERDSCSPSPVPVKKVKQEPVSPEPGTSRAREEPKKVKPKVVKAEPGRFEQMLASGDKVVSRAKKLKPMDWSQCKIEVDANYRPQPALLIRDKSAPAKPVEEEFNPEKMFKPRNDRQKVFAGRRKVVTLTEVPSLFSSCMKVIMNNIDAIEETGDIPFSILRPVLERCSAQQLAYIESKNPYLEEDSDELWEKHFTKSFPGKESSHDETWKEAYFRYQKETENKLAMLTRKIGHHKSDGDQGQRKAMLADALAPNFIRKRQMKSGLSYSAKPVPSAKEVSQARRQVFNTGSTSALAAIPSAVINRTSTVGAKKTNFAGPKPAAKKGALMLKTMKMLNIKRR